MSTLYRLGFCRGRGTRLSFAVWLPVGAGSREDEPVAGRVQSRKRWQAFFQRQAVHHWSRCSMPYTLRHFLASPRAFLALLWARGGEVTIRWDFIAGGGCWGSLKLSDLLRTGEREEAVEGAAAQLILV